jgi:hypothetical protein|tara:strand:- start:317 stop:532 length:216 start_codon:yes stop_codon:yes gene_type:complete
MKMFRYNGEVEATIFINANTEEEAITKLRNGNIFAQTFDYGETENCLSQGIAEMEELESHKEAMRSSGKNT